MAAIIVHGGAFAIPDSLVDNSLKGCQSAVQDGYKILQSGGSALDAVERAVMTLEDNPIFNAGHGSVLNCVGDIEMDALIMDGATLNIGTVAGVKNIANPVSLARKVMEKTNHTMIIGEGANQFALELGIPQVTREELFGIEAKTRWKDFSKYGHVVHDIFSSTVANEEHDTVGAVARDQHGNIACATSTGGITHKRVGRVGDSPIIGCGGYADNDLGGVSTTGHGESITKVTLASRVLSLTKLHSPQQAIENGLRFMWDKVGGCGGLILITPTGEIAKGFTTERMAWASIDTKGTLEYGNDEPVVSKKC